MIIYKASGDLLDSKRQVLVCPVNLVGVMGKGLALSMADRFAGLKSAYQAMCRRRTLGIGKINFFPIDNERKIALLPTKYHWRDTSDYDLVYASLEALRDSVYNDGIKSIAISLIGCGVNTGQLDRKVITDAIYHYLDSLDIPVDFYNL